MTFPARENSHSIDILAAMNPLRNPNINYFKGWFFVTFQVAMNKSVFGVISDKKLILNRLGEMVPNVRTQGT